MRTMTNQFIATASAILMATTMASADIVYQENFDTFSAGSMTGQNGWTATIADGVDISTGSPDKQVIGDGSDGGSSNDNLFFLGASTQSISIEMNVRMRANSSHDVLVSLIGGAGSVFQFGNNNAGWRMRSSDGSALTITQPTNDEKILTTTHRYYDVRVDYDFVTEVGSLNAKYLAGDADWSVVHSFTSADLGLTTAEKLPSNWSGLTLRADSTASQIDDIVITAMVPEPASLALLGLGGLALILRRRK